MADASRGLDVTRGWMMRQFIIAGLLASTAFIGMARAVEFSDAIVGSPIPDPPYISTDVIPLIRGGETYKLPITAIGGLGMALDGSNATLPDARNNFGLGSATTTFYYAKNYGSCAWSGTTDVGVCINLAIVDAAAAGGGTVVVPAGTYYVDTQIINSTDGVKLSGAGIGMPRDSVAPNNFIASTRLIWNGANNATMAVWEPSGAQSLFNAGIDGIVFDCNAVCNVALKATQVSYSKFHIGVAEALQIGAWFTTNTGSDAPGNQFNEYRVFARHTSTSNDKTVGSVSNSCPTGLLFDGNATWNTSVNQGMREIYAWHNCGDGIVFGNIDNNDIGLVGTYPEPAVLNGRPVVFSNSGYIMPNGLLVGGGAYGNHVYRAESQVFLLGFNTGTTVTAGGGNTGTGVYNPITIATNATTAHLNKTLNFASTTGIVANQAIDCGPGSNMYRDTTVVSVTSTTLVMNDGAYSTVPSGQSCTGKIGVSTSAVAGTYTLTATNGTTFNLTAPAGGNTQTGIVVSGGAIAFADMTIPFTGTPNTNDTWAIVTPTPSTDNIIDGVDKANSIAIPMLQHGATGLASDAAGVRYGTQIFQKKGGFTENILLLRNDNGFTAFWFGSDPNRFPHFSMFDSDGITYRASMHAYYSSVISPQNYASTGGLDIGATASSGYNHDNGGYGLRVRSGPVNGAARFGGSVLMEGSSSGIITLAVPSVAGTNTLTFPAVTDTVVTKTTTDVLTNKTLTAPVISAPSLSSGTLTNVPTPSADSDAVPKSYADSIASGVVTHAAAAAATTANLTATASGTGPGKTLTNSGAQAAFATDGYSGLINERFLIKDQTNTADNGIYTLTTVGTGATNWVLTRATDFDAAAANEVAAGASIIIVNGTVNARTNWVETGQGPFTLETTPIILSQVVGASASGSVNSGTANQLGYYAGAGTAISGLATGNNGVLITGGGGIPSISSTIPNATQDNITRLGTIATGVWTGTPVAITYGGTGVSLAATGGTSQVLKQETIGANISVGTLSCTDLSNDAPSCATDTTNATNIGSGTLAVARLPAIPTSSLLATATNDNAGTGIPGEFLSATGTAVAVANNTQVNITSRALTPGDWDVSGQIKFNPAATTTSTIRAGGLSLTSATLPVSVSVSESLARETGAITAGQGGWTAALGTVRVSTAGTPTVYCVGRFTFATSTATADCVISARRVR